MELLVLSLCTHVNTQMVTTERLQYLIVLTSDQSGIHCDIPNTLEAG